MPNKEKIQQDIESKTKELDGLKSRILHEVEQTQKDTLEQQQKQLEQDIQVLQKQLDEFKDIEITTNTQQAGLETKKLKNTIEIDRDWTYELITWTKMHEKLLTVLWSEAKVETFALEIDKVVRKYLDQELSGVSNAIKNGMSVGIQFAMMETLISQWSQWSTQFFESFSTFQSSSSITKSFEWLYKIFGKLWSANQFYLLANKVQNLTRWLSDHSNTITTSDNIPELIDPNQFRKLLNQPVWSYPKQITTLDISKILTLHSSSVDIHAGEAELKKIIDNEQISSVITEGTISSIQKSLGTADKLLDTRGNIKDKATGMIDKISWLLDIDIPFLGNLGELMGMKFPTDFLERKKDGGVINFILWILGFQGWIKWLHKSYIKEKLDASDIDDSFISAWFASYLKHTDASLTHDSATSIWKICWLRAPTTLIETSIKSKLPTDYVALKQALVDTIQDTKLNPLMVAKFAPQTISTQQWQQVVDMTKVIANKDTFADAYLKFIIPTLIDPSNHDFISSPHVDKDTFILAVLWALSGDKYFIEGINLWLIPSSTYAPATPPEVVVTPPPSPDLVAWWLGLEVVNSKINYTKGNFSPDQKIHIDFLIKTMQEKGITDPNTQIGILSVIGKESQFIPHTERSYASTSNRIIRNIFGARVAKYSESQLETLKKSDKNFFDAVYWSQATPFLWWDTENTQPGDGYKYRGRGFNQLSFKHNYKLYGNMIDVDLVKNPDLLNTPDIAAKVALAFFTKWVEYATLPKFTDKQDAAKYFADLNSGWNNGPYISSVVQTSNNFDIQTAVT